MLAKILIASLLKPIDDVRSFERFSLSLAPDFQVFIFGSPSNFPPKFFDQIDFFPLPFFPRTFFQRIQGIYFFTKKLFDSKPDILIIQSPELLIVGVFYKLFFAGQKNSKGGIGLSFKLIYDIQENYFNNILYQNYYTNWKKYLLAFGVRAVETFYSLFVDCFFLAEKSYERELSFINSPLRVFSPTKITNFDNNTYKDNQAKTYSIEKHYFLIENKYAPVKYEEKSPFVCLHRQEKQTQKLHFIYTGTVSEVYGTHRVIEFIKKLYIENQEISLVLIGCCSDQRYWDKLNKLVIGCPYIDWKISKEPVRHALIMAEIEKANFGILGYLTNRSTENCVPSKIYEYIAYSLPILMPANPFWESITAPYKASFRIDFENFNAKKWLEEMQYFPFYKALQIPETVWKFDREEFKKIVLSLYSQNDSFK